MSIYPTLSKLKLSSPKQSLPSQCSEECFGCCREAYWYFRKWEIFDEVGGIGVVREQKGSKETFDDMSELVASLMSKQLLGFVNGFLDKSLKERKGRRLFVEVVTAHEAIGLEWYSS